MTCAFGRVLTHATSLEVDMILHEKLCSLVLDSSKPGASRFAPKAPTTASSVAATQSSTIKFVPVYKWNLQFSGDDNFTVKSSLNRVEELSVAQRVGKDKLFSSAIDLFSGSALVYGIDQFVTWLRIRIH